jgi:hypothetical protein
VANVSQDQQDYKILQLMSACNIEAHAQLLQFFDEVNLQLDAIESIDDDSQGESSPDTK